MRKKLKSAAMVWNFKFVIELCIKKSVTFNFSHFCKNSFKIHNFCEGKWRNSNFKLFRLYKKHKSVFSGEGKNFGRGGWLEFLNLALKLF